MNDYDIKILKLKEAEKPQPLVLKPVQNNVTVYNQYTEVHYHSQPGQRPGWWDRPYTPTVNYYVEDYIDSGDAPDWMMTAVTFIGIAIFLAFLLIMCVMR